MQTENKAIVGSTFGSKTQNEAYQGHCKEGSQIPESLAESKSAKGVGRANMSMERSTVAVNHLGESLVVNNNAPITTIAHLRWLCCSW